MKTMRIVQRHCQLQTTTRRAVRRLRRHCVNEDDAKETSIENAEALTTETANKTRSENVRPLTSEEDDEKAKVNKNVDEV